MALGEVSILPLGHATGADSIGVALHAGQPSLAAQSFNMPALSPTMTEGNIATWKLKEGTTNPTHHDARYGHGRMAQRALQHGNEEDI